LKMIYLEIIFYMKISWFDETEPCSIDACFAFINTEWIYSIKVNTRIPKHNEAQTSMMTDMTHSVSYETMTVPSHSPFPNVRSGSEQNHPSEAIMQQIQVIAEKIQKHFNFQRYKTRATDKMDYLTKFYISLFRPLNSL